jgi:hypothetical protein
MEIPVYDLTLEGEGLGLQIMSMVGAPAIMLNCVKFSEAENIKFSMVENYIFGPALVPNLPIYRNINGKEFYLRASSEVIAEFHLKACKDNAYKNIDFNHNQNLFSGVTIDTMFRTHPNIISSVPKYEDLPLGTLFIGAKVENQEIVDKINSGEINGWSIDAMFKFEPSETLTDSEAQAVIEEIFNNK